METTTHSTEETKKVAEQLAETLKAGAVIALFGDLGVGKTTFTRYLVEALGFDSRVQSPTFVIARKYTSNNNKHVIRVINHLDLYRLTSKEETEDLGLSEVFSEKDAITLVEWPELILDKLPKNFIKIEFIVTGENSRNIKITKHV
jgi:tRNA threonylcarbamoyladenosine biosynthesis protein TsaE